MMKCLASILFALAMIHRSTALEYPQNVRISANSDGKSSKSRGVVWSGDLSGRKLLFGWLPNADPPMASPAPDSTPEPTMQPTQQPTSPQPTASPTAQPTASPTAQPTASPTAQSIASPTTGPTQVQTTKQPTTSQPTTPPTSNTTSEAIVQPTQQPTTPQPTAPPTAASTPRPTGQPTIAPSKSPTASPSSSPSASPSESPSYSPSASPSVSPTFSPTLYHIQNARAVGIIMELNNVNPLDPKETTKWAELTQKHLANEILDSVGDAYTMVEVNVTLISQNPPYVHSRALSSDHGVRTLELTFNADFSIQAPMEFKNITFVTVGAFNSNYKKGVYLENLAANDGPAFENASGVSVRDGSSEPTTNESPNDTNSSGGGSTATALIVGLITVGLIFLILGIGFYVRKRRTRETRSPETPVRQVAKSGKESAPEGPITTHEVAPSNTSSSCHDEDSNSEWWMDKT